MNNTNNILKNGSYKEGEASRMRREVDIEFIDLKLWDLFRKQFKSKTTEASYRSDIGEFCRLCGKRFQDVTAEDVRCYYEFMSKRSVKGKISPLTVTKKFRELHSFAQFLEKQKEASEQGEKKSGQEDFFYPYLKHMEKERDLARSVPIEDMDRLLDAASDNRMEYAILSLMYRAGLSSTEIISLNGEDDLVLYGTDAFVMLSERKEPCYIPQDAWKILMEYMDERETHPSLFYNRNGRRLNTMYISRMMKKLCVKAGIPNYSAEAVRNCCAFNLFAYGASSSQVAGQMGRTEQQIRRYKGLSYRSHLSRQADELVRIHIESP